MSPEQKLWIAVVARAVEDLFLPNVKSKDSDLIRKDAYSFLFYNSPGLSRHRKLVFERAGFNPRAGQLGKLRKRADEFELNQ